eukprot:Hpha_TRINITY_DN14393_c0_g1::TRINITY_DN14393_c0_g1_i1::g.86430::m.86430
MPNKKELKATEVTVAGNSPPPSSTSHYDGQQQHRKKDASLQRKVRVHLWVVISSLFIVSVAALSTTVAMIMLDHAEKQADQCQEASLRNTQSVNSAGGWAVQETVHVMQDRTGIAIKGSVVDYISAGFAPIEYWRRRFATGEATTATMDGVDKLLGGFWDTLKANPSMRWIYITTFPNGEWLAIENVIERTEELCETAIQSAIPGGLPASFCDGLSHYNMMSFEQCCSPSNNHENPLNEDFGYSTERYHYFPVDGLSGKWIGNLSDGTGPPRWDRKVEQWWNDGHGTPLVGNGIYDDNGTYCCGYTAIHTVGTALPREGAKGWRIPFLWTDQHLVGFNAAAYHNGEYLGVLSAEFSLEYLGDYLRSLRRENSTEEFFLVDRGTEGQDGHKENFLSSSCRRNSESDNPCLLTPRTLLTDPGNTWPNGTRGAYFGGKETAPGSTYWNPLAFWEVANIQGGLARALQLLAWGEFPDAPDNIVDTNCSWCPPGKLGRSWSNVYDKAVANGGNWRARHMFNDRYRLTSVSTLYLSDGEARNIDGTALQWLVLVSVEENEYLEPIQTATADALAETERLNKDMRDDLDSARDTAIIIIVVVGIVILLLTFLGLFAISAPLRKLSVDMSAAAVMDLESVSEVKESIFVEIANLQRSFVAMIRNLAEFRRFLPETVMLNDDDLAGSTSIDGGVEGDIQVGDRDSQQSSGGMRNSIRRQTGNPLARRGSPVQSDHDSGIGVGPRHAFSIGEFKGRRGSVAAVQLLCKDEVQAEVLRNTHTFVTMTVQTCKELKGVTTLVANWDNAVSIIMSWNGHKPCGGHAHQACQLALNLVDKFADTDMQSCVPCIAITSGLLWCGNVGTDTQRFPYLCGDPVGQACCLSRLCEHIGTQALCGAAVYEQVRSVTRARVVDATLRGEREDLIYELMRGAHCEEHGIYVQAFSCLRAHDYDGAIEGFKKYLAQTKSPDFQALRLLRLVWYLKQNEEALPFKDGERTYARIAQPQWLPLETMSKTAQLPQDLVALEKRLNEDPNSLVASRVFRGSVSVKTIPSEEQDAEVLQNQVQKCLQLSVESDFDGKLATRFTDSRGRTYHRSKRCLGRGAFGEVWLGIGADGGMVAVKSIKILGSSNSGSTFKPQTRSAWEDDDAAGGADGEEEDDDSDDGWTIGPSKPKQTEAVQSPAQATEMSEQTKRQLQEMVQEVQLMSQMQHDNIVQYLGCAVADSHVLICMEYLPGGSLAGVLQQFDGQLPGSTVQRFVRDIIRGLQFIHSQKIVHRDLKPANVLMTVDGVCKLADFGASAELKSTANQSDDGSPIGTPMYMPPEQANGIATTLSDIWSLGIVVIELATGKVPWEKPQNILAFIVNLGKEGGPTPPVPEDMPEKARDLAGMCLQRDPSKRPSARSLINHPYILH